MSSSVTRGDALYSPQDVANMFNVTRRTVYVWLKTGMLNSVKAGPKLRYITQLQLDTFIRTSERTVYRGGDLASVEPEPEPEKVPAKPAKKGRRR